MIQDDWDTIIKSLPNAHFLQSSEWGKLKTHVGWKPIYKTWTDLSGKIFSAAMVLQRQIPIRVFAPRIRILYTPKGPLLDWSQEKNRRTVLNELRHLARDQGAIFIKIDPDVQISSETPGSNENIIHLVGEEIISELEQSGWIPSKSQIQFRNTIIIDLKKNESELLSGMKPKTRYNIRLAEKKGVKIRFGDESDLELMYRMYAETSIRDGFTIREPAYYQRTWGCFYKKDMADLIIAEVDQEPVAGLIMFRFGEKAWYMYGMSRNIHREKMPNYLLQWSAMQQAISKNCKQYDLWGAPDKFDDNDPMWGVYKFKEGLGGKVVRSIGAWDFPVNQPLYHLYNQILPKILNIMRRRGKEKTSRTIDIS